MAINVSFVLMEKSGIQLPFSVFAQEEQLLSMENAKFNNNAQEVKCSCKTLSNVNVLMEQAGMGTSVFQTNVQMVELMIYQL